MLRVHHLVDGRVVSVPAQRLAPLAAAGAGIVWVQLAGNGTAQRRALEDLGVAPLVAEDVLETSTHPKAERHRGYWFAALHALDLDLVGDDFRLATVELDFLVGGGWVVTHTDAPLAALEAAVALVEEAAGDLDGPVALLHLLLDTLVDDYQPFIDDFIPQRVDEIETALLEDQPAHEIRREIALRRRDVNRLLRAARPQAEAMRRLTELVGPRDRPLMTDVADRFAYVAAQTESLATQLDTAFDHYESLVANAQNEVMKVLTMVSALLLPLTVITGVYGMNFRYMPELREPWGYPAVLAAGLVVVAVNLAFFRARGWIGRRRRFSGARTLRLGAGRVLRAPAVGARAAGRSAARLAGGRRER